MQIFFEAEDLHTWMTAGNKLTDISGGSEILELLVQYEGGLLGHAMQTVGITATPDVAAASRIEISEPDRAKCEAFCRLWPLVVRTVAPGLGYVLTLTDDQGDRARFDHPGAQALTGPLVEKSARTGGAISGFVKVASGRASAAPFEPVDAGTRNRRVIGHGIKHPDGKLANSLLVDKIRYQPDEEMLWYDLDVIADADELSEARGRRSLAYVYADGSGLGQLYAALRKSLDTSVVKEFSQRLDAATQASVRKALSECAQRHPGSAATVLDVRPVMVGGDDMVMIVPAMFGYCFAVSYMRAFVAASRKLMAWLGKQKNIVDVPPRLDVGCGIAFVHPHFPASSAIHLADSLCSWAKVRTGRTVSALAMFRVTGSTVPEDFDDVLKNELTRGSAPARVLTGGPYLLDPVDGETRLMTGQGPKALPDALEGEARDVLERFKTVDDLTRLTKVLASENVPRGAQRDLLDLAYQGHDADLGLRRIFEVGRKNKDLSVVRAMSELDHLMLDRGTGNASVWFHRGEITTNRRSEYQIDATENPATALSDVHALISVADRPGRRSVPVLPATATNAKQEDAA